MKITYDSEADALYIRLVKGRRQCRTLRLNDDVALNIGARETLVGIEILNAKEVLGHGELPPVVVENLPHGDAVLKAIRRRNLGVRKTPSARTDGKVT